MKNWRTFVGAAFWLIVIGAAGFWLFGSSSESGSNTNRQLSQFVAGQRNRVDLDFERDIWIRSYDPIFYRTPGGNPEFVQVGAIQRVESPDSKSDLITYTNWARAEFFSNSPEIDQNSRLTYYQTPESMDFVIKTMLPPEKRKQIARLITETYARHHQELFSQLQPILEKGLSDAGLVIQQEFKTSIENHRTELEKLGARYQEEFLEARIIPLVNQEIWPIVREESEPLLNSVGEEIWNEASVWRFGWAFIYDATPLPQRDLAKKEFNRFVENKAMPIISDRMPEFIALQQSILAEVASNPKVVSVVKESLTDATRDPELQSVVVSILQEVFVNNERLNEVVNRHWTSSETQELLELADDRLEPTIVQIGELMFGNPHKSVTPEFARVLRSRVLMKDHRWLLLTTEEEATPLGDSMPVTIGPTTLMNPFYYPTNNAEKN